MAEEVSTGCGFKSKKSKGNLCHIIISKSETRRVMEVITISLQIFKGY